MIGTLFALAKAVPKGTWRWIAVGALVAVVAWWLYDKGRDVKQAEFEAAEVRRTLAVAQEEARRLSALQAAADEALRASQRERQQATIVRERILKVTDEVACLDQPVPEGVIDALRE